MAVEMISLAPFLCAKHIRCDHSTLHFTPNKLLWGSIGCRNLWELGDGGIFLPKLASLLAASHSMSQSKAAADIYYTYYYYIIYKIKQTGMVLHSSENGSGIYSN